jgi:hypothetical protein
VKGTKSCSDDYFDISIQNEMQHLIDAINLYKTFIIDQFVLIPDI